MRLIASLTSTNIHSINFLKSLFNSGGATSVSFTLGSFLFRASVYIVDFAHIFSLGLGCEENYCTCTGTCGTFERFHFSCDSPIFFHQVNDDIYANHP